MSGAKLLPLYEQVARLIQGEIEKGKFAPGQKIYSIREICESFNVSDVTAKKSLRELGRRGIVRSVSGSGVFVKEAAKPGAPGSTAPEKKNTVAFLKVGANMAPVFASEIDFLQQEMLKLGCPMTYSVAASDEEVGSSLDQLLAMNPIALIVFPQHRGEFEKLPYLSRIRRAGPPVLILETRSPKDSYVTTDTERATQELANYLHEIGHRRICLATVFPRKVAGFEAALKRWNDRTVKHSIIGQPGKTAHDAKIHVEQILALKPRPTAIIAADDQSAALMIIYLQAAGLRVPEDISIVTYGDFPNVNELTTIPLTLMRHPVPEIIREVSAWIQTQLNGGGSRRNLHREISGSLIVRDSSCPPG